VVFEVDVLTNPGDNLAEKVKEEYSALLHVHVSTAFKRLSLLCKVESSSDFDLRSFSNSFKGPPPLALSSVHSCTLAGCPPFPSLRVLLTGQEYNESKMTLQRVLLEVFWEFLHIWVT
jgi:hypothetical protein